jgi:GNAT superfamily N-acetyltransferase
MPAEVSDLVWPAAIDFARRAMSGPQYDIRALRGSQIDRELVRRIIEDGFEESLVPGFFEGKDDTRFLLIEDKGVAVLAKDYLDVIAVAQKHQRNGVGPALMGRVIDETGGRFYCRTQPHREANRMYEGFSVPIPFTSADGIKYNAYISGYEPGQVVRMLDFMVNKPSNFVRKK